jgi:MFS family permease
VFEFLQVNAGKLKVKGELIMEITQKQQSLFKNRDYLKLWMGHSISGFGSQFSMIAVPLLATIILEATAAQMGLLTSLGFLPFLVFGLFAGVWVDRINRRPILVIANLVNALTLLLIPLLYFLDSLSISILYVVQFIVGTGTVFTSITSNSYLPSLIKKEQLIDGNSKFQLSTAIARIAGNSIGGGLIYLLSAPIVILLDAITYVLSAFLLLSIKSKEPIRETRKETRNTIKEIKDGLQVVFGSPIIRTILFSSTFYNFFYSMFLPLFILFVSKDLELSATIIGVIFAMGGVGSLIGSSLAQVLGNKLGIGSLLSKVNVLTGLSIILMVGSTLFTHMMMIPIMLVAQIILSACATIYSINTVSLRTAITPNHLLGRTNASLQTISFGILAVGPLLGGGVAEFIGNESMMMICGVGIALSTVVIYISPIRTIKELPKAEEMAKQTA